jgi:hypothetical protein
MRKQSRLAGIATLLVSKTQSLRPFRAHQSGGVKGPGRSGRSLSAKGFKPGDPVKQSGIYEVVHDLEHRTAHDVVMIAGDEFPSCETCNQNVRFRLVRTAPYIFQDQDFEEGE